MSDESAPAGGGRSAAYNPAYLRAAASVEAVRLGHPEVDIEHLLLALLVTGGPSARLLLDAGVTLDRGRQAVVDVQQHELADLGVNLIVPAPEPARYDASMSPLPLSGRARELDDRLPFAADDRALLTALIDDEGGRVRRLLTQLGVDADVTRQTADATSSAQTASSQPGLPDGRQTSGLRPGDALPPEPGWLYVSHSQDVPVPADPVWALISDPERRAEWGVDCSAARVRGDGTVELTRENGTTVTQVVPLRRTPCHDSNLPNDRSLRTCRCGSSSSRHGGTASSSTQSSQGAQQPAKGYRPANVRIRPFYTPLTRPTLPACAPRAPSSRVSGCRGNLGEVNGMWTRDRQLPRGCAAGGWVQQHAAAPPG